MPTDSRRSRPSSTAGMFVKSSGAVLEGRGARGQDEAVGLDRGHVDGPAGEPGTVEPGQGRLAGHERPHARGVAEHLVEGEGHEVGVPAAQVEAVRGHEGGGVEQHVAAPGLRLRDPLQGVLDARRSWTARERRRGCARPGWRPRGPARARPRPPAAPAEPSAGRPCGRRARGRTRGCRSPSCGCRRSAGTGRRARTGRTRRPASARGWRWP